MDKIIPQMTAIEIEIVEKVIYLNGGKK